VEPAPEANGSGALTTVHIRSREKLMDQKQEGKLAIFGISIGEVLSLLKVIFALSIGLGGAIFGLYCHHIGFLPQNATLGDGILFALWTFFFAISYMVIWIAEFSASLVLYALLRLVATWSQAPMSQILGRSVVIPDPLPRNIRPMMWLGMLMLPLLIGAVVVNSELRGGIAVSLGLMTLVYGVIITSFRNQTNQVNGTRWIKFAMYGFLGLVPVVPVVLLMATITSVAKFAGVRMEGIDLTVSQTVAEQILNVETAEGIDPSLRIRTDDCIRACVLQKVDVPFTGIGDRTLFEVNVADKAFRFIVPTSELSFAKVSQVKPNP
jgi:hypothetical protein